MRHNTSLLKKQSTPLEESINIIFSGIDRATDKGQKLYEGRQRIYQYLYEFPTSPLCAEILVYTSDVVNYPDNHSISGIDEAMQSFDDRILKEESKARIVEILTRELGPESSKMVLAYIQTLEELTATGGNPPVPPPTAAAPRLSPFELDRIGRRAKQFPWKDRQHTHACPKTFLLDNYGEWIGKGLTMAVLRNVDRDLYHRLHNWRRKEGNNLPPSILPGRDDLLRTEIARVAEGDESVTTLERAHISERLIRRRVRAVHSAVSK